MDSKTSISRFWGPQVGDPLWEDWVLGRETMVYMDRSVSAELSKAVLPSGKLVVILNQNATQVEEALLAKILGALNLCLNQIVLHRPRCCLGSLDSKSIGGLWCPHSSRFSPWAGSRILGGHGLIDPNDGGSRSQKKPLAANQRLEIPRILSHLDFDRNVGSSHP